MSPLIDGDDESVEFSQQFIAFCFILTRKEYLLSQMGMMSLWSSLNRSEHYALYSRQRSVSSLDGDDESVEFSQQLVAFCFL